MKSISKDTSSILAFAKVVDKYDCVSFLQPHLHLLFDHFDFPLLYNADVLSALHLLDDFDRFEQYTSRLIREKGYATIAEDDETPHVEEIRGKSIIYLISP